MAGIAQGVWARCAVALLMGAAVVAVQAPPADAAAVDSPFVQVAAGGRHTCALTVDGHVWCWGDNARGQLGREDVDETADPVLVESVSGVTAIDAGGAHTCAIDADDAVWCWGANGSGQLGDGTTQDRAEPARALASGVTALSTGRSHTCAVSAEESSPGSGVNEVQQLRVEASRGTYTLSYRDPDTTPPATTTTAPIRWDAGADEIDAQLDNLSAKWDATVWAAVSPNTHAIAFTGGPLARANVPATLQIDASGLKGSVIRAQVAVVSDGGQKLLCWGSDAASQLGRGEIADADLVLEPPPGLPRADAEAYNSLAADPASGDLFLADTAGQALWRFTDDGRFVSMARNLGRLSGVGVADVSDGPGQPSALRVYTTTDVAGDVIRRYDATATGLGAAIPYSPWTNPQVLPPGWDCTCKITAFSVDPDSGGVFAVLSGSAGLPGNVPSPYLRLIRVSSDVNATLRVVDYAASFANVADITDITPGADAAGNPVLYVLEQPTAGSDWKVALWDIGGTGLSLRARFSVNPANRPANDASANGACPTQDTSGWALDGQFWKRTRTTYGFDFGRMGSLANGDLGVITKHTPVQLQVERYVKDPQADPQAPADPNTEAGTWVPDGDPTPVSNGPVDACVNDFAAGSQAGYGRFVTSYRGADFDDTDLGSAPSDVAVARDGRVVVVDTDHDRLQQFSADGIRLTQWPGAQYSAYPAGSTPASWVATDLASRVTGVSAGDSHTCASTRLIAGGDVGPVLCWGSNAAEQLGYLVSHAQPLPARSPNITGDRTSFPVVVADPQNPSADFHAGSVSVGDDHSCASDTPPTAVGEAPATGATVSCWGDDADGQLITPSALPGGTVISTSVAHSLVDAGGRNTCLVETATDEVVCHGPALTDVSGLQGATSLSSGSRHACAIVAGEPRCWGDNAALQLGRDGPGSALAEAVLPTPRVAAPQPPASLRAPIAVVFDDATSGVSPAALPLRDSQTTLLQTRLSCLGPDGQAVSCAAGPVRTAQLRVKGGLVAGESYTVAVNATGDLTAGGRVVPATLLDVAAPTRVEEDQLAKAYTWGTVRTAAAYGRSMLRESAAGASADYRFRGDTVTWFTATGPQEGAATVAVDGKQLRVVDNSAKKKAFRVARTFRKLGPGPHTLTITATGRPGARGVGRNVSIDAFRASGGVVATPSVQVAWGSGTLAATPPATTDTQYSAAGAAGSAVRLRFRAGTQLEWHTVLGKDQGKADVYIDGALVQRVDNHATFATGPANRPTTLVFPVSGGTVHTLRIVAVGGGRGAHLVSVDGFSVA